MHLYQSIRFSLLTLCLILFFGFISVHAAFAANYTVSGKTNDGQGHYIGGVQLSFIDSSTNIQKAFVTSSITNGNYSASVPEGTYKIQATPTNQTGAYQSKTITGVVVSSPTSLDISLDPQSGSVTLSGKLLTPQNEPITPSTISLSAPGGGIGGFTSTDAQGSYFFRVLPRNDFQVTANWSRSQPPRIASPTVGHVVIPTYAITQDSTQDMVVPVVNVQLHVQNPNGTSVNNASVSNPNTLPTTFTVSGFGNANATFSDNGSTNTSGDLTVHFFPLPTVDPNLPVIEVYPPTGSQFYDTRIVGTAYPSDTSLTMTLSTVPTIHGSIHDSITSTRLANQTIEISKDNTVINSLVSNSIFPYNFYTNTPTGTNYTFKAHANGRLPGGPTYYEFSGTFSQTQSREMIIPLPLQLVNVTVKDSVTNALVAAHVSATSSPITLAIPAAGLSNITGYSSDAVDTDSNFTARMKLFNTSASGGNSGYTITAVPLDPHYLPGSITNISVNSNMEATVFVSANHAPTVQANGPYTVNAGSSVTVNATGSDADNDVLTYAWDLDNNGSFETNGQSVSFSAANLTAPDVKTIKVRVTDAQGLTGTDTTTVTITSATPTTAINAGGSSTGNFDADANYSGGQPYNSSLSVDRSGVDNAAPESVYQSVRYGNFNYTIPNLTPNADYTVRLHFNELYWGTANSGNQGSVGSRVFNVSLNGTQVLSNYDIYEAAGGADKAIVEQLPATADSNGTITIQFATVVDNAMVNGIELYSGTLPSPTPTPTPTPATQISINSGGAAANSYLSDRDYSGGQPYSSSASVDTSGVNNAAPESVYQSVRYGNITYTIPNLAPNTTYHVRLHFNELYWGTALTGNSGGIGSRVFNVSINALQVLTNYDIYEAAGGANKAIVEEFTTTANANGKVTIVFSTVVDNAIINGIELFQ